MSKTRVIMIGGFLGAGKTTTIARLAKTQQSRGRRVAVVTNDHAADLVDTHNLRSQGLNVGEIPGGCFCGSVDELVATFDRLSERERPDLLFVEPIGSCADLAATVIRPLQQHYEERFDIAPYCVLLKPMHAAKILRGGRRVGVAPKAEYLFRKQLEEADVIALNRMDTLTDNQAHELEQLLAERHPEAPVVRTSAKTGQGFGTLAELLEQHGEFGRRTLELDYQEYAAAEAELGWLNSSYAVRSEQPFDLDQLLWGIVASLRESLANAGAETAHLKIVGFSGDACAVVNLVDGGLFPERSLSAGCAVRDARLIVNARVAAEPALLSQHTTKALEDACRGLDLQNGRLQSFRPGQPQSPVYTISLAPQ